MTRNSIAFACAWLLGIAIGGLKNPAVLITSPPKNLSLDPFYKKYIDANGIPVVSSEKVTDQALVEARVLVVKMLSKRDELRKALIANKTRVAIMAPSEVTIDIPEHKDLYQVFPGTDWNNRCRGVGATKVRPVCSVGEENLLGYQNDRYRGESILIHEFGHTILNMGISNTNTDFIWTLKQTYNDAISKGLWKDTYAGSNADEYWAEGVQDWFDANLKANPPNGIHNEIHTRKGLKEYDPDLFSLLAQVFPDDEWRYCYPKLER